MIFTLGRKIPLLLLFELEVVYCGREKFFSFITKQERAKLELFYDEGCWN
jgi:hypothetical protein